jgi:uncharacterized protein (DUF58 family)
VPKLSLTRAPRRAGETGADAALHAEAEALAAKLPPLLVAAERLASVTSLGVHGRRKAGIGETFWQFRRYREGDPTGAIDWRQSAKSQHLFVREREWEAAEVIWFWRDNSPGMHFASDRRFETKGDRASLLVLALASLLARGGERIALLGGHHGPASGRAALKRMARELIASKPDEGALPPDVPMGRSAQLVWASDFLAPLADIEAALRRCASAGISGHFLHVIDPAEQDFPYSGRTRFEWQRGRNSEVFGRAESVRDAYCRRFAAQGEAVAALARRLGWTYLVHRTDHRPEIALIALYANLGGAQAHDARDQAVAR